ncbi:MAG: MCE family protein [Nitrospirae bacterium]|nr:MCE family protein [Nitrospirota bacterium]
MIKAFSTELKVGVFAVGVILILTFMTFKVGGFSTMWKKGYRLYVAFDNISGLEEKSKVKVAGVDAGIVEKTTLTEGKAMLTLLINPQIKIRRNTKAAIRAVGLLGDKYLALSGGSSSEPLLKDGEVIQYTEPSADIDALATELTSAAGYISDLAETMTNIFGASEKESLKETINNLKLITKNINEILHEDREPLHNTLVKLESFSKAIDDKGPGIMDDLRELSKELKEVVKENRYALKDGIENMKSFSSSADKTAQDISKIAQKIDKGEGTLGKLLKDDSLYNSINKFAESAGKGLDTVDRLRTFMDFHSEYLTRESEWKGYFDLVLQPRKDKYYILGVTTDPLGSSEITETTVGGVTTREEEIKKKIEFTAQFAKRLEDFALRIGMLESTFGVGADYFFKNDKARVRFDMWDFNADEAKAKKAHAKIGLDYKVFKYLFISSGIDNILNEDLRGIYVGGGLKFEDEDFKYIFGGGGPKLPGQ